MKTTRTRTKALPLSSLALLSLVAFGGFGVAGRGAPAREPDARALEPLAVDGGGHSLAHPTAPFLLELVGRTSRDVDGGERIWDFFARQAERCDREARHKGEGQ